MWPGRLPGGVPVRGAGDRGLAVQAVSSLAGETSRVCQRSNEADPGKDQVRQGTPEASGCCPDATTGRAWTPLGRRPAGPVGTGEGRHLAGALEADLRSARQRRQHLGAPVLTPTAAPALTGLVRGTRAGGCAAATSAQ